MKSSLRLTVAAFSLATLNLFAATLCDALDSPNQALLYGTSQTVVRHITRACPRQSWPALARPYCAAALNDIERPFWPSMNRTQRL